MIQSLVSGMALKTEFSDWVANIESKFLDDL